jgi:arylformamidase
MAGEDDAQFQYVAGQLRPTHAALLERFAADNARAEAAGAPQRDMRYGPHPRQTLDLFKTNGARRGLIAYFHAGYWQSRDKSGFSFLAPPLTQAGFDVAILNYPLAPESSVPEIVSAARGGLHLLGDLAAGAPLLLAGHSAGAQIAIELAMGAADRIAAVLAISGVYDLVPLLGTTLNDKLGLDPDTARAASPLHRVVPNGPPVLFAVGESETRAFRDQTAAMAQAWAAAGNSQSAVTVPGADHFTILTEMTRADGPMLGRIGDLADVFRFRCA